MNSLEDTYIIFSQLWKKSNTYVNINFVIGYTNAALKIKGINPIHSNIICCIDRLLGEKQNSEELPLEPCSSLKFLTSSNVQHNDNKSIEFMFSATKTVNEIYMELRNDSKQQPCNNVSLSQTIPQLLSKQPKSPNSIEKQQTTKGNEQIKDNKCIKTPLEFTLSPKRDKSIDSDKSLVGTCTSLEKKYLRIVDEVRPCDVRPVEVLIQSFDLIKQKQKDGAPYSYLSEQLKSMRQDLVVQKIVTTFTREVYQYDLDFELHNDNLTDVILCISKLMETDAALKIKDEEHYEYVALNLLYTHTHFHKKGYTEMLHQYQKMDIKTKNHPLIKVTFDILKYYVNDNSYELKNIFETQTFPRLLDLYIKKYFFDSIRNFLFPQMRFAFNSLPIKVVTQRLLFDDENDCKQFLTRYLHQHTVSCIDRGVHRFFEITGDNVIFKK
ncbi:SAC3/GANP family protein [Entamoeba marina]